MAYPEKQSLVGRPEPEISDRSRPYHPDKDSAPMTEKRETASTGAVRETLYHKGPNGFPLRPDLLMRNDVGFRRLAETYGEGFLKYGADNWMQGFPESVLVGHAIEHISKHLAGDRSEDHIAHAIWNLYTLAWVQEKKPELMDLTDKVADKLTALFGPEPGEPT